MTQPDPAVVPPPNNLSRALSLALRAVNGWACYATRELEHREIAFLHREIANMRTHPVADSAVDPVARARADTTTRDETSLSSSTSAGAGVRAGAPASPDLRTAAADLVHALRYYGFSYNRDIVKAKIAALAQALETEPR